MSKSAILPYRFLLACMWRMTFIIISVFNRKQNEENANQRLKYYKLTTQIHVETLLFGTINQLECRDVGI